ncbi:MAG: hypothetical protein ACQETP_04105, partial [Bacteroidota bacterium]
MQSSTFSTWTRSLGLLTLAFALLFSLSACDSTDSNEDDDGPGDTPPETVNMSIGDDEVEMNAFFATGEDPDTGEQGFLIYLTEADDLSDESGFQSGDAFGVIGRLTEQPGTGTYSFADIEINDSDDALSEQFGFIFFEGVGTQNQRFVLSNGGTLELTTSNSDRVAGTFDI